MPFRHLLLASFLLLGAFASQAQTLDDLEFGLPNTLDIATWNIEWFPKNGNATVERVQTIIQNLDIDLWAIQEIDDTTAFKGMIDAIDGYEYVLMDGWFGDWFTSTIPMPSRCSTPMKFTPPRRFGIHFRGRRWCSILPLKANRFMRLTTTLNAAETGPSTGPMPMMKKRGVTRPASSSMNTSSRGCPKSGSSCSGT